MPRKKSDQIKSAPPQDKTSLLMSLPERIISYRPSRKIFIIILIAGALLLAFYKKEWFIAATVNGTPVSSLDLLIRMNQQFRTQTLNQLINEKIILQQASQNNISISEQEISSKIGELEKNVGGAQVLESLLSQQGQTRSSIRGQLRLQLMIEKLYQNEATISAYEVDNFIKTNPQALQATEEASQRKEAADTLKQQKINQIFSEKFQQLRQKADVKIF